jgi:hypothetical protein
MLSEYRSEDILGFAEALCDQERLRTAAETPKRTNKALRNKANCGTLRVPW